MKAKISQVKAELSKYIRLVLKGEEIIITDRDQPVARLSAIPGEKQLQVREPSIDLKQILKVADRRSFDQKTDILDLLTEDREDRL